MTELYDPLKGEPTSASQQQELTRLARRKITGPHVLETPDGIHFRPPVSIKPITVVVVVKPTAAVKTLKVRKVAEKKDPPEIDGDYGWADDPFDAWPDYGRKAVEYAEFYLADQEALGIDTKFLRARRVRSIWKAEHPGMGVSIRPAVVTSLATEGTLNVKYLDAEGELSEEPEPVLVWFNMTSEDWATFVGTDIVIPVMMLFGLPHAMQLPRWDMMLPPGGVQIGDCRF